MTSPNTKYYNRLRKTLDTAETSREWSSLPQDYEAAKVRIIAKELIPHLKSSIRGRIQVSKATTFTELRDGLEIAILEMEKRLDKYTTRVTP